MGFDREDLARAVARHGRVARVVVAAVAGSAPREVGAAMLVWPGGQSGTIGGGALEYEAAGAALTRTGLSRHPLGPALGQCCGGAVTLLTEHYDAATLPDPDQTVLARGPGAMPLAVRRMVEAARRGGEPPAPQLVEGWMVEPLHRPRRAVWIWGAGHVGRALAGVLAPLPELELTWIDTERARFPETPPERVTLLPARAPVLLVPRAPREAAHVIVTFSHALDLDLCHALLGHGFGSAGLIGSDTKWARFRTRLRALGHADAAIDRITCPIGRKSLGKHPQAIALGVAVDLLNTKKDRDGDTWPNRYSAFGA
ncbi:xanthine dehydrogenase accessory protein XdhC [Roseivivax sp. CAU 1761]